MFSEFSDPGALEGYLCAIFVAGAHRGGTGELFNIVTVVFPLTPLNPGPFRAADEADREEGNRKRLIVMKSDPPPPGPPYSLQAQIKKKKKEIME